MSPNHDNNIISKQETFSIVYKTERYRYATSYGKGNAQHRLLYKTAGLDAVKRMANILDSTYGPHQRRIALPLWLLSAYRNRYATL